MKHGYYLHWNNGKSSALVKNQDSLKEAMDWCCECAERDGVLWRNHWWQLWRREDPRKELK